MSSDNHRDPRSSQPRVGRAAILGMALFLASLSMLFGAGVAGYLVVRFRAEVWPPAGMPRPPQWLWASTAILVLTSAAIQAALAAVRQDDQQRLRRGLTIATVLGVLFLVSQAANWSIMYGRDVTPQINLYGFTFYLLTVLHAVHVLGGLLPLAAVARRARLGRYGPAHHIGVKLCAMYWHFLGVVWLVVFVLLMLTT